jgi:hypothetical protein
MDFEAHVNRDGAVPDVLLVRKSYEEKRRKTRGRGGRAWKLKHLPIEAGEDRCVWVGCNVALQLVLYHVGLQAFGWRACCCACAVSSCSMLMFGVRFALPASSSVYTTRFLGLLVLPP